MSKSFLLIILLLSCTGLNGQTKNASSPAVQLVNVADGWSNNSINTVIFRKNSLVSYRDTQFIAFYNPEKYVVLGKRQLNDKHWILKQTEFKGDAEDAHNSISIMVDGDGFLHLSWDHHNNPLRYSKSVSPGALEMTEKLAMTRKNEQRVSYPEFYKMPNGNLLFFYRNGESGQGNLVLNIYDTSKKEWTQVHNNLIDGEGKRNAYSQICVDTKGTIHISWVWRESADVASNHDMCYARSKDNGKTWERSTGERYNLPITALDAEFAAKIPQNSELINQTSMATDSKGNAFIATYWKEVNQTIPQYHVVYNDGITWHSITLDFRKTPFSLNGVGTKQIPISRPQIMVKGNGKKASALIIFRDEERNSKASVVIIKRVNKKSWNLQDLSTTSLGSWEPTYDTELWKTKGILNLFVQKVTQVDGEGQANVTPEMIQVLEYKPVF